MNQIHIARILGSISPRDFQRAWNEWFINSIEPQLQTKFDGGPPKEPGYALHGKSSMGAEQLIAHNAGTNCLAIDNSDGRFLVSGGADAGIHLWDLEETGAEHVHRPSAFVSRSSRGAHTHAITTIQFYPFDPAPSTLISSSFDKTVKLFSITPTSLGPIHTFPLDHAPYTVALSPLPSAHPLIAVGTAHPASRLLDLRSGLGTHSLPGHNGGVYSISWSPKHDYILTSGAADGRVLFFDIRRANAAFGSLDLDDAVGVEGADHDSGTGARKALDWNARAHAGPVTGVQWTADGDKIVTAGHDNRLRVFDVATGKNDLVHFGPRIRNNRVGPLNVLLSPPGCTRPGQELLYWPNDDGKGDIYIHSLREGNLLRVLSTPGVQRTNIQQGRKDSIQRLTSGGRINALVWRVNAAGGQSIELYSANGDGKICRWAPAHEEENLGQHDENSDEAQQVTEQEQARKRKRELVADLVAGLSNKTMRV